MSFLASFWVTPTDYANAAATSARLTINRLQSLDHDIAERFGRRYERPGLIAGYALGNAMNNLQAVKSRAKVNEHVIANDLSGEFLTARLGVQAWTKLMEATPCFRVARIAGDWDALVVRSNPTVDPNLMSRTLTQLITQFESESDARTVSYELGKGNLPVAYDLLKLAIAHYRAT